MEGISQVESGSLLSDDYLIRNKQGEKVKDDRNQFLELMIAQLENQDPLSPQENGEFLAQLAQFSSVDGIERLNETMSSFTQQFRSSQALEATALVGRKVAVKSDSGWHIPGEAFRGLVNLPASTSNVRVEILNSVGEVKKTINLGQHASGDISFNWDGLSQAGDVMQQGSYGVRAFAEGAEGPYELETYIHSNVDSVTINQQGGIALNIPGRGSVDLAEIKQIE